VVEARHELGEVRHARADGGDALALDLGGGCGQVVAEPAEIRVKQQSPVVQPSVLPATEGAAGDLSIADDDVVPAGEPRLDADATEPVEDHADLPLDVVDVPAAGEREVRVAEVVVDGAAAGGASRELHAVAVHVLEAALHPGVLVAADDDRRPVPPQVEHHLLGSGGLEEPLLEREVEPGVVADGLDVARLGQHGSPSAGSRN
jgi:hypothetical protein